MATGCVKGIIRISKFSNTTPPSLETVTTINGVEWKKFEKNNKWNVMKTVYKTSTKKKGKNKMSKVTIDVDVANPQIRSVCLGHRGEDGKDGLKILVGTRGSEIVEFNISSKTAMM